MMAGPRVAILDYKVTMGMELQGRASIPKAFLG